jgi:hypothetical protein
MYEEENDQPTVDERIDFLRRVKKASDQDLADVIEHPERWKLPDWQMEIISDQRRRRLQDKIEAAAKRFAERTSRNSLDEAEQERLEQRIREKILRERYEREKEEILKQTNNKTTKTKTEKEDITMAAAKNTEATETAAQNATPKFDTKAIIGFKVAEMMTKAMDQGKGIPLTKITVMQNLADGKGLNVNEIVKARYTENFMKELDANKDIPLGKLIAFQTLQENGNMDINAMVQARFVEKLFDEFDNEEKTAAEQPAATEQKK